MILPVRWTIYNLHKVTQQMKHWLGLVWGNVRSKLWTSCKEIRICQLQRANVAGHRSKTQLWSRPFKIMARIGIKCCPSWAVLSLNRRLRSTNELISFRKSTTMPKSSCNSLTKWRRCKKEVASLIKGWAKRHQQSKKGRQLRKVKNSSEPNSHF